jgi:hypothetical protein
VACSRAACILPLTEMPRELNRTAVIDRHRRTRGQFRRGLLDLVCRGPVRRRVCGPGEHGRELNRLAGDDASD